MKPTEGWVCSKAPNRRESMLGPWTGVWTSGRWAMGQWARMGLGTNTGAKSQILEEGLCRFCKLRRKLEVWSPGWSEPTGMALWFWKSRLWCTMSFQSQWSSLKLSLGFWMGVSCGATPAPTGNTSELMRSRRNQWAVVGGPPWLWD